MSEGGNYDLDFWTKHRESSIKNKWYGIERIDLLIVSICSGGLYVCFEIIKFLIEKKPLIEYDLLKWSSVFFALGIIINLLSQYYGSAANKFEAKYAGCMIKQVRNVSYNQFDMKFFDKKVKFYNKAVFFTNAVSIAAMALGIMSLCVFCFFKF